MAKQEIKLFYVYSSPVFCWAQIGQHKPHPHYVIKIHWPVHLV